MQRRDFLKLGSMALAHDWTPHALLRGEPGMPMQHAAGAAATGYSEGKADVTLHIAPVTVELDRAHILSTTGYNGSAPGPVLRLREGKPITVDVINDTDTPEFVHWHGLLIPPEADGTEEEGSPVVAPHGRARFNMTPGPVGTRWYHSHAMAMDDLHKGAYTGQFGFVYIEGASEPGRYDQEHFLALRDWEPFFTGTMDDDDDD